jgi:CheY-like chemotaxis protein
MLRSSIVEWSAKRFHDALRFLTEATPLFEKSSNDVLKGKFHNGFGFVLRNLGGAEGREDYIDRALIEYAAASYYFEQAGLTRHQGCVENNLGFLFCTIGRFAEAHEHLDRAQALFTSLRDRVHLAQVDETRARVMLAEGRIIDAEKLASFAVRTLENGGERSLLAEALTTQGTALARLRDLVRAEAVLQRASEIAEQAGDSESAGQAALVMIEELGTYLPNDKLKIAIDRASESLRNTQEISTLRRVVTSACRILSVLHASPSLPPSVAWTSFSVEREVLRYEAHFIKLALKDSDGRVTRAARLLGLSGHQSLQYIINSRHKDLLSDRTPIVPRKRSFTCEQDSDRISDAASKTRIIRILHVEDDPAVAVMIKATLESEGWQVEGCADGTEALERITSNAHYDLLLLDYDLPGLNGLKLLQQARALDHRRGIPVIVLSGTPMEEPVMQAGADVFLRKPEDISLVVEAIAQLLSSAED